MKRVVVLIPCYNEEDGIGKVLDSIPKRVLKRMGYACEALVIDNNSKDKTAEIARSKGATVVVEKRQGKGWAMRTGFREVDKDADYVVILDGDATYKGEEMPRLLELLDSGFCDVTVGSRLGGRINGGALNLINRIGNWMFTFVVRQFYMTNVTDVLSGYIAMKREVVEALSPNLESEGFAIEMELITKLAKCGFEAYSVPITYAQRAGESKLEALSDGIVIAGMLIKNVTWRPKGLLAQRLNRVVGSEREFV